MHVAIESLESADLQLSKPERAQMIERLIASINADSDVEEAWFAEVERRNAEIDSGAASLLSGPETLAKLRAEFQ